MNIDDAVIRKFCSDTVAYAKDKIEPILVYWSRDTSKFGRAPLRNLRSNSTSHIVGVYNEGAQATMIEDDIRHWLSNRPPRER